ncbi:MAG: SagB family peptide dehydrogenase [Nitriliruptorales bacterium]
MSHAERATHHPQRASPARDYHERTKHSLVDGGDSRRLDWANKPLPYKLYTRLNTISLPREWYEAAVPAAKVLSGEPSPTDRPLDLSGLARLLFLSAGVTRRREAGPDTAFFRAAPSAGALYPVEVYVVCGGLLDLPAGLYHFEPVEFVLRRLRRGDVRSPLAKAAAEPEIATCVVTVVLTGIPWRTTWKYGARGYRHLYWDAGAILANLLSAAAPAGLAARVLAGFVDAEIAHLLGVDSPRQPFREFPLAIAPLGPAAPRPPPGVEPPGLELDVVPLSPQHVDEPELLAVHAAGTLESEAAVASWRQSLAQVSSPSASPEVKPPPAASRTLDEVVLRRGSTRRFARTSVPQVSLEWGMAVASSAVPADFLMGGGTLLDHLLIVHAVDGIDAGAYRWTSEGLELVRGGGFRDEAARLCLDQALGGDGAFTVFECAGLEPLLDAAGARAYRAAQLEAGIAAERLQLAAFALDIGGSGLTFYDDDVRRFFGVQAEPMLTVAIGAPDYEASPGKPPSQSPPGLPERWGRSGPWT